MGLNQSVPFEDVDLLASDPALREALEREGAGWARERVWEAGVVAASAEAQAHSRRAERNEPRLVTHDRFGDRVDGVELDPSWYWLLDGAVERGIASAPWADPRPGAHVARAALELMWTHANAGVMCPVSMTYSAVPALRMDPAIAAEWEPRLRDGALCGMAMTEKQGGSDVRANRTTGVHMGGNAYEITGHKWFCSAPMSDAFLVLAQTRSGGKEDGLTCLFVPRILSHGTRNPFRIQRLKDKLGNRSNASAEVELDGTVGFLLGEPGRGVRAIIEMVQRTRLDCVLGSAAGMRQAVAEAVWHARGREAFGALLIDQPAMTAVLADLALEAEAALLTGLRLAQAFEADASPHDVALRRLATPVAKYWVCKRGPQHAYEAMECLGGNGYTESFPLAMRYREQPVMAIWEGTGNVIALDVLRAMTREPDAVAAFADEIRAVRGASALLDGHVERTLGLLDGLRDADPAQAQAQARRLAEALALALQGSLMV
ncbi:MAG TPA: acyl-CoA dehydrogenase family protein, partial [Solirubrobacter sp.]|nr:acyl-CoA dehydrogenase family protein [Solirubrobacter sp.]